MSRLHWYLSRRLDQLSVLTLLAWLSVIALIIAVFWLVSLLRTPPVEQVQQPDEVEQSVTVVTSNASSDLLSGAPKLVQVTKAVETLYQTATQHQLTLEEVVYQDQQSENKQLVQYAIDFGVQQSYPRIKAFMTELLAALPYLALEQVSFERDDINNGQIQSHLRFKLFLDREDE